MTDRKDHHDYAPGVPVLVCIDGTLGPRWRAATFLGTRVGVTLHASPVLVVQTRDGVVWNHCAPEFVRSRPCT